MEREVILCDCNSLEHQVVFSRIEDDEDDTIYVSFHLYNPSFWSRLKYLFGHKSRFGAWDEVCIPRKEFIKMLKRITK